MDKNWMVALMTDNEKEFEMFNRVASEVTREYHGFWQVGNEPGRQSGYAAWELWHWPHDKAPIEVLNKIQEKMRELSSN